MGMMDWAFGPFQRPPADAKEPSKEDLETQKATPIDLASARSVWADSQIYRHLTPEYIANLLQELQTQGYSDKYIQAAQELERILDAQYRELLSQRRMAVLRLERKVAAASEDKKDEEIAQDVRADILGHAGFGDLLADLLDALGKGYAVSEIIWELRDGRWLPKRFAWVDQRWFRYYEGTGWDLGLLQADGVSLEPLMPKKFIVHEPHLLSGPPVLGGLAIPALFYAALRRFVLVNWGIYSERHGRPILIGKYGRKASKQDISTLKTALKAMARTFGAVVSESTIVEVLESKQSGSISGLYESLNNAIKKELSQLILGQTMTTDNGSSQSQATVHNEVRLEVRDFDALQLSETINKCLIRPYVDLNFGNAVVCPKLVIAEADSADGNLLADTLSKLVPLGLRVGADEVRKKLGLNTPEDGDEILQAPASAKEDPAEDAARVAEQNSRELNAASEAVLEAVPQGAWDALTDEAEQYALDAFVGAKTLQDVQKNLKKLFAEFNGSERAADVLALQQFEAFCQGAADFDKEPD